MIYRMDINEQDIIYELYKVSSSILPEKADWSIDDLYNQVFKNDESMKPEEIDKLREILKKLEKKNAVIFKDGFNSIDLIESELGSLIDSK